jgi:hypothetical protein
MPFAIVLLLSCLTLAPLSANEYSPDCFPVSGYSRISIGKGYSSKNFLIHFGLLTILALHQDGDAGASSTNRLNRSNGGFSRRGMRPDRANKTAAPALRLFTEGSMAKTNILSPA